MQIKILNLTFLLLVIRFSTAKYLEEKPAILTPCFTQDANFKSCYAKNIQVVFKEWVNGVPGLKTVGGLDPIFVKRIRIAHETNSNFVLHAIFDNMKIRGAGQTVVKEAFFDRDHLVITAKISIPKMRFESDYKAKGQILALSLNGHGKSLFETENIIMSIRTNVKIRHEDAYSFTELQDLKVNIIELGGLHINMENLFNGQKDLEASANALFNENWRQLFEILRPAITQTIEAVLFDRLKKVLNYVPANYFFIDAPKAA